MKYKITLGGRGSECYSHELNDDQTQKFKSSNLDIGNSSDYEEILKILNKDNIDECEKSYVGALYDTELLFIDVSNDQGKTIWEYTEDFDFENEDYIEVYEETNHFIGI